MTPDIAIVGVACRFPEARSCDELWTNLTSGRSSIREMPPSRWEVTKYWSPDRDAPNKSISKWCGVVDDVDRFDHRFFEVSPREAKNMDPQQRILLEETLHCIEDSGVPLRELQERRTAVFAGIMGTDYHQEVVDPRVTTDAFAGTGNYGCILANRLSYAFGLSGKSFTIDAACASSLVAIHEAKLSLQRGESDFAIVGGASINTHPWKYVTFSKARMLSPDGRCKTFDMDANGYVPGDGVGVLLLQRADEAARARARIYGIVRGSAVGHGGRARSMTAPRVEAQKDVILRALADGAVDPRTIGYVEAHGTGTSLGDPIEIEALTQAYRVHTSDKQFAKIGSLKTNIGHLEAAAGVAGVIKVLMMLRHAMVPKTLNVERANPIIDFESSPFSLALEPTAWTSPGGSVPRRAGVSSFGIGGVNSHVVIEEYVAPRAAEPAGASDEAHVFALSAKSEDSLRAAVERWRERGESATKSASVRDLCATLAVSGGEYAHRHGAIVRSHDDIRALLSEPIAPAAGRAPDALVVRDFELGGFGAIDAMTARCPPFRARLEALTRDVAARRREPGLDNELRAPVWSSDAAPVLAAIAAHALVATLGDLGWTPRRVFGERRGLLVALACAGAVEAVDAATLARDPSADVAWRAPSIAVFDPKESAFVTPLAIDEAALRNALSALHVDASELAACVEAARLSFHSQYTFKHLLEEWSDVLALFGGADRMLAEATSYASGDRRGVLLFCAATYASRRLDDKWSLRRSTPIGDAGVRDLVDLVSGGVLSRAHVAEIATSDRPDFARIARECDPSQSPREGLARFASRIGGVEWLRTRREASLGSMAEDAGAIACPLAGEGDMHDRFQAMLLDLWRRGAPIRWNVLHPAGTYAKLALPPYPFDRESFWIREADPPRDIAPARKVVSVDDSIVRDHVIGDRCVVPAASMIDRALFSAGVSRLERVVLHAPAVVVGRSELHVDVLDGLARVVVNGDVVAHAKIVREAPTPPAADSTPVALRAYDATELYADLARTGYAYGESLRVVRSFGDDGTVAIAAIDASRANDADAVIAPEVLDGVLQAGLLAGFVRGAITFGADLFVPSFIGAVTVHGRPRGTVHARITAGKRAGTTWKIDARVDDSDGRCLLELRDVVFSRATPRSRVVLTVPTWIERPLAQLDAPRVDAIVLAIDDTTTDRVVAEASRAHASVRVLDGSAESWLAAGSSGACVYFLSSLAAHAGESFDDCALRALFEGVKALAARRGGAVTIVVPVRDAFVVVDGDRAEGHAAGAMAGFAKAAMLECPGLRVRVVDTGTAADAASAMIAEGTRGNEDLVAYRGSKRFVRELRDAALATSPRIPLFEEGKNVLLVGGVGGIGRHVLDDLAGRTKCRVIVLGRAANADPRVMSLLQAPRACDVHYVSCDVADRAALDAALCDVRARFGAIHGVLHLGGVLDDGLLAAKTWDAFRRVLAPKIDGARNLHACTLGDPLDFFVAFGSIVGVTGNIGQSDYAAANAFLDTFIAYRAASRAPGRSLVIDWPLWEGVGMGQTLEGTAIDRSRLRPISSREGIEVLEALWSLTDLTQVIVEGEAPPASAPVEAPATIPFGDLRSYLRELLASKLDAPIDSIDDDESLFAMGFDSLLVQDVMSELHGRWKGLPPTLLFEHPSLEALVAYFEKKEPILPPAKVVARAASPAAPPPALLPAPPPAPKGYAIAIIGMSGRFPKARDVREFWRNLVAGTDCVIEIPRNRWDATRFAPYAVDRHTSYGKWGGFLDDIDRFDPLFFHVSPREAEEMDPQQRLFLECVWETMEDAGYGRRDRYRASRVGLYVGTIWNDYSRVARDEAQRSGRYAGPGSIPWAIANRVSYFMDFKGPSLAVDTACSSSLVAIHLACQSILAGDCEMAIAGGVNLSLHPDKYVYLSQAKFLATDGRCRSFGEGGDGYVPGEGVGAVLLKPLAAAMADGDEIYGVIRGTATNHGGKVTGFTVPSPDAQADVITRAMERAGVRAEDIGYVECHGTGTALGDPIETRGLAVAFSRHTTRRQFCPIGSAKSNIGHLEAAAGVAGLIKTLLAIRYRTIPRSLHSEVLNPKLELAETPFYVAQASQPWVASKGRPRVAGISSFGAGGSNAHLIVEEHEAVARAGATCDAELFVLSAKDDVGLEAFAKRLRAHIDDPLATDALLGDVAHTLQIGREHWKHRVAIVARDLTELASALDAFIARAPRPSWSDAPIEHAAAAWERGEQIDWAPLAGTGTRRIARLPTYPFKRDRFWIAPAEGELATTRAVASTDRWLVDHVVGGTPTLPGACAIELVLGALEAPGEAQRSLSNVVWLRPIVVAERAELGVAFDEVRGKRRFTVWSHSGTGDRVEHAQGTVDDGPSQEARALDLNAIRARCATTLSREHCYDAFARGGIVYGGALRVIHEARVGTGEAIASLVVRDGSFMGAVTCPAPASVIDGALQVALAIVVAREGAYVPFALGLIVVADRIPDRCVVHARRTGGTDDAPTFDVNVASEAGLMVASLRRVVLRRVQGAREPIAEERYYASTRTPRTLTAGPERSGDVVVFEDGDTSRVDVLGRGLTSRGAPARIVRVRPGRAFRALGEDLYEVAPDDAESNRALVRALVSSGVAADRFVHLWSMARDATSLDERVRRGYLSVLFFTQALVAERATSRAALVYGYAAGPDDPAYAAVAGLLRTIAREKPDLASASVGFESPRGDVTTAITQELLALDEGCREVLYAGGRRLETTWTRIAAPAAGKTPSLDAGDTCLVTGGAGGLGLIFAEHLVQRFGARVVLVGRSPVDAERADRMERIGRDGAVTYLRGDVSSRADVGRIVAAARALGPLRGIVHAAGVTRDSYLVTKTRSESDAVLAAKVDGTVNLDDATRSDALRFFALFSSVSAVFGNAGQSDYAYANAFLDAFARRREEARLRGECSGKTVSIDWPLWGGVGMGVNEASATLLKTTMGLRALRREEGVRAFDAALSFDGERVMIVTGDGDKFDRLLRVDEGQATVERTSSPVASKVQAETVALMSRLLKVPASAIDVAQDVREYGFDSITLTRFANAINEHFNLEITPAIFFEHATLASLVDHLCDAHGSKLAAREATTRVGLQPPRPVPAPAPVTPPVPRTRVEPSRATDIAIVGLTGVFPGSKDVHELWAHLEAGHDLVSDVPAERLAWWDQWTSGAQRAPEAMRGKRGGLVAAPDRFDAAFFGLSPREADFMDPQQRLFLETVWNVVEDAGYRMSDLWGSRTGLFVGVATSDYSELMRGARLPIDALTSTGVFHSILANRISYLFNLTGPSEPIDTACSSSLVAVQRAVDALRAGRCEMAIAGGVSLLLSPTLFLSFEKGGMLSPDGRCKTFDKSANGYVRGEGSAAVLLKPLDRAMTDGDHIYGVIKGVAVAHAGRANSMTAPNPNAQADLLVRAYTEAGVAPERVGLIETHGTGTSLGDPIEVAALKKAFGELFARSGAAWGGAETCALGAVKTNIGHLEAAAGIAGLTKALLAMAHGRVPGNAHFKEMNPFIDVEQTPFFVPRASREWPAPDGTPRVAGVSSFGFGGVNAHVVIEEHVAPARANVTHQEPMVLVLSAKTESAMRVYAASILRYLEGPGAADAADVVYTLQVGREALPHRLAIHADGATDLVEKLRGFVTAAGPVEGALIGAVGDRTGVGSVLVDGDEGRVYLRLLAERRRLDKLAQLWVAGVDVDWRLLHEGASRRRVPLPTYPFERVRHWYDRHVIAEATPPAPAALPRVANGSAKRLAAAEKLAAEQLARPEPKTLMANAKPAKAALDPGAIRRTLRSLLAGVVFVDEDEIDDSRPFVDVGLDSLLGVEFVDRINKTFSAGAPIVDTDLYRRSSVADLADLLASRLEASGQ